MDTSSDHSQTETSYEISTLGNNNINAIPTAADTPTTATGSASCSDNMDTSSKQEQKDDNDPDTPVSATAICSDAVDEIIVYQPSSHMIPTSYKQSQNESPPQISGSIRTISKETEAKPSSSSSSSSASSNYYNFNDDPEFPFSTNPREPVYSDIIDQTCSPPQISNLEISCTNDSHHENRIAISMEDATPSTITTHFIPCKVHRVCSGPRLTTSQKLRSKLCEIFFPDDPLYVFKNQGLGRKFVLAIEYVFPMARRLRSYSLKLFRSDLIAGITIASLAIPQGISYAKLANIPPITGLYSSFLPPLIYAVFGSSRNLCVGPVSVSSMIIGTTISEQISPTDQRDLYIQLVFTSTLFAGLFQTVLGILRLGFIVDFLSKATLTGFMAALAVIVSLQQLKGLLGITHFTSKMQIIPVLESVFSHSTEWSRKTIVLSVFFLLFILIAQRISSKRPKLFWIAAAAPITSVILSTLLVAIFRSSFKEISMIGHMPKVVNPASMDKLYFHGPHFSLAVKTGILVGIISLTEGLAVARTFASLNNYQIDGNKEMIALGLINVCGCLASCYVATGSFSRSAVAYKAGGKSAMSNVIMSLAVLVTLLFLLPLFFYTPNLVLAAIIVTAVIGLVDVPSAYRLWKLDKLDFLAFLCSFVGVLFISVPIGLAIAVGVSLLKVILHVTRPNTALLGKIPGTELYQSLDRYKNASRIPSFLILSIESPIFFANSSYLQERIMRWIRDEQDRIQHDGDDHLRCIILDMTAVTSIDSSGLDAIVDLKNTLNLRSLQLVLVNPTGSVLEKLLKSKVIDSFTSNGLYLTIAEAVFDISASWQPWP